MIILRIYNEIHSIKRENIKRHTSNNNNISIDILEAIHNIAASFVNSTRKTSFRKIYTFCVVIHNTTRMKYALFPCFFFCILLHSLQSLFLSRFVWILLFLSMYSSILFGFLFHACQRLSSVHFVSVRSKTKKKKKHFRSILYTQQTKCKAHTF